MPLVWAGAGEPHTKFANAVVSHKLPGASSHVAGLETFPAFSERTECLGQKRQYDSAGIDINRQGGLRSHAGI